MSDVLLDDAFAGLRAGVIGLVASGPYLEMHGEPASPEDNADGWQARSGNWAVLKQEWVRVDTADGAAVESRSACTIYDNVYLAKGEPDWRDYRLETSFEVLPAEDGRSWSSPVGAIVRFVDSQNYYAAVADGDGQAKLLRRLHDHWDLLANAPFDVAVGERVAVSVEVRGTSITARLGECVLKAKDAVLTEGCVGLLAARPARFGRVRVTGVGREAERLASRRARGATALASKRKRYAPPVLVKRWQTHGFGCGRQMRFGDLEGRGRTDFLLGQTGTGKRHGPACLTAMNWDGEVLWRLGEPVVVPPRVSADLPMQIHDVDGDGANEVVCVWDGRVRILDGRTGEEKRSVPVPMPSPESKEFRNNMGDWGAGWSDPDKPMSISQIAFADLAGRGAQRDVLIKSGYHQLVALSPELAELWRYTTCLGHFPQAWDFDGDGREDVLAGYTRLSPDGERLGRICMQDHQDAIYVGPLDEAGAGPVQVLMAGGEDGLLFMTPEYGVVPRVMGHVQRLAVGRFRGDMDGLQIACVLFHGNPGIVSLFDRMGRRVWTRDWPVVGATLQPVNWDGSGVELMILTGLRPAQGFEGGLIDGEGDLVVPMPDDGGPGMCMFAHDFDGDGLDELLAWDHEGMSLYHAGERPRAKSVGYRPERPALHNLSNFQCYWSRPRWV